MFIALLFTIAQAWKQLKCPSRDEKIKMWCNTMRYYSLIKKPQIMLFAETWMQLEIIILSEVNQKEKDKYHIDITHMWNLKYRTIEPIYKTQRSELVVAKWKREGRGMDWKFGVDKCKLLHLERINNRSYSVAQGTVSNLLG